jgi:hypothetical protein
LIARTCNEHSAICSADAAAETARDREAHRGRPPGEVVVAVGVGRVGLDRADLQRAQRDLFSGRRRRDGEDDGALDATGVPDAPLESAHRAHRSTDDAVPGVDAEFVGECDLDGDLVADRDERERRTERPIAGVGGGRSGRTLTTAKDVRAHDEVLLRVNGRAGSDERVPPAGRDVSRTCRPGGVRVAGECVQDEDRVRTRLIQLAPRLEGDAHAR